jgi:hypothetical protein
MTRSDSPNDPSAERVAVFYDRKLGLRSDGFAPAVGSGDTIMQDNLAEWPRSPQVVHREDILVPLEAGDAHTAEDQVEVIVGSGNEPRVADTL